MSLDKTSLPGRTLPVDGKKFDLKTPTRLEGLLLDDVLTDLGVKEGWTALTIYEPAADITVLSLSDAAFNPSVFSLQGEIPWPLNHVRVPPTR